MAAAAITTALSTFHISKPYSIARNHLRYHTLSTYSLSSSSSEFITTSGYLLTDKKLVDPWRGDASSGRVFHVIADASAVNSPTKKKLRPSRELRPIREMTSEPRYSKAARRFYNENFKESSSQRLSKVLAAAGVASRRSCEELIFEGKVTVNGSVCNTPQTKVDPKKDMIYVNGNRLPKKLPPKVYLALNKPKGYICSSGETQTKSVISLFNDYMKSWDKRNPGQPKPRLFTVGRLDVARLATTGLIIVTNDDTILATRLLWRLRKKSRISKKLESK